MACKISEMAITEGVPPAFQELMKKIYSDAVKALEEDSRRILDRITRISGAIWLMPHSSEDSEDAVWMLAMQADLQEELAKFRKVKQQLSMRKSQLEAFTS